MAYNNFAISCEASYSYVLQVITSVSATILSAICVAHLF